MAPSDQFEGPLYFNDWNDLYKAFSCLPETLVAKIDITLDFPQTNCLLLLQKLACDDTFFATSCNCSPCRLAPCRRTPSGSSGTQPPVSAPTCPYQTTPRWRECYLEKNIVYATMWSMLQFTIRSIVCEATQSVHLSYLRPLGHLGHFGYFGHLGHLDHFQGVSE